MPVTIPQDLPSQRAGGGLGALARPAAAPGLATCSSEWELRRRRLRCTASARSSCRCVDADGRAGPPSRSPSTATTSRDHEGLALQHWGGRRRRTAPAGRPAPPGPAPGLAARPRPRATRGTSRRARSVGGLYGRLHVPALPQLRDAWRRTSSGWLRRPGRARRATCRSRGATSSRRCRSGATCWRRTPARRGGARRPPLRQRDGRRGGGVARHRPQADERRPALRAGADAVEPDGRAERPRRVGSVRDGLRRRFHALVDAAGLDEDRARDWVVVRMVLNAGWTVQDARRAGPPAHRGRAGLGHPVHRDHQGRPGLSRGARARQSGCLLPLGKHSDLGYSQVSPARPRCVTRSRHAPTMSR